MIKKHMSIHTGEKPYTGARNVILNHFTPMNTLNPNEYMEHDGSSTPPKSPVHSPSASSSTGPTAPVLASPVARPGPATPLGRGVATSRSSSPYPMQLELLAEGR